MKYSKKEKKKEETDRKKRERRKDKNLFDERERNQCWEKEKERKMCWYKLRKLIRLNIEYDRIDIYICWQKYIQNMKVGKRETIKEWKRKNAKQIC